MKIAACILALAMSTTAALSGVAEDANSCWNVPMGAGKVALDFEVTLGEGGKVTDIDYLGETPAADSPERVAVLSASRAIERCSPYRDTPVGIVSVTMSYPPADAGPIDPFAKD